MNFLRKPFCLYVIVMSIGYMICTVYVYFKYRTCRYSPIRDWGRSSSLFGPNSHKETLSQYRQFEKLSEEYVEKFIYGNRSFAESKENEDDKDSICVVIPTVKRRYRYLTVLLSSLLHSLPTRGVVIKVINFSLKQEHKDFERLKSKFFSSDFFEFVPSKPDELYKDFRNKSISWAEKEIIDFTFSMKQCEGYSYIVFLEDDCYASKNVFQTLRKNVFPILEGKDWFTVKLFVSDFWAGFDNYFTFFTVIPALLFSLLFHFLVTVYLHIIKPFDSSKTRKHLFYHMKLGVITCSFLSFVLLSEVFIVLCLGRVNLQPRKRGTYLLKDTDVAGSWIGTVAQLYNPKHIFPETINFLEKGRKTGDYYIYSEKDALISPKPFPLDILLVEEYYHRKKRNGLDWNTPTSSKKNKDIYSWYITIPSLFQHIGFSSSNPTKNQLFEFLKQSNTFKRGPFGYIHW